MGVDVLLDELERLDVRLSTRGGRLVCNAPPGVLTDELRGRIKRLKPRLVARLQGQLERDDSAPVRVGPLSLSQARILALATLLPEASAASNIPFGFRLTGALDREALDRALQEVVRRHEVFRSCRGPESSLIVHPRVALPLPLYDLRARPEPERSAELRRVVDATIGEPFDLGRPPILRAVLVHVADDEWVLVLVTHVFVFDGRSTPLLLAELGERYADFVAGRDPSVLSPVPRYSDFARRQRQQLTGDVLARQRAFWVAALAGASPLGSLPGSPLGFPPGLGESKALASGPGKTLGCGHVSLSIPDFLTRAVEDLARSSGATLFHTLLTAWMLLLQRHTGQRSLTVGTIVSNRRGVEAERTIGSFANNILLRADFAPGASVRDLLSTVRGAARSALAHLDIPFEGVLAELEPSLRCQPPFRVMFVLHQGAPGDEVGLRLPGLRVELHPVDKHQSPYWLDLVLTQTDGQLRGSLTYGQSQLSREMAEALVERYLVLLKTICRDPEKSVDSLPAHGARPTTPEGAGVSESRPDPPAVSPPVGPVEQAIGRLWSRLLGRELVDRDRSFFDQGGHSLLALAMLRAVEAEQGPLGSDVLALFAERPTITTLARLLASRAHRATEPIMHDSPSTSDSRS